MAKQIILTENKYLCFIVFAFNNFSNKFLFFILLFFIIDCLDYSILKINLSQKKLIFNFFSKVIFYLLIVLGCSDNSVHFLYKVLKFCYKILFQ